MCGLPNGKTVMESFPIPEPSAMAKKSSRGAALRNVKDRALVSESLIRWREKFHHDDRLGGLVQSEMLLPPKYIEELAKLSPAKLDLDLVRHICSPLRMSAMRINSLLATIEAFDTKRVASTTAAQIQAIAAASRSRMAASGESKGSAASQPAVGESDLH